jgi:hypothetical protein
MQYKVLAADSPINEKQLERLAHEGWQLITVVEWRNSFYFYFIRLAA